jgi:hypothetical protein
MRITLSFGAIVEVVVLLRKFRVVFNSSSTSLLLYSYLNIKTSSNVGSHEAKGSI